MSNRQRVMYSSARIAARVAKLGREITRACNGKRLDVVVTMDRGFIFAADLLREIDAPVVAHFVHADVRDVEQSGHPRREVTFKERPNLRGRDVLLLDAVIDSGVTQEFLLRRLGESQPRSLRMAVLVDKPARRHVALEPDYFGFQTASNELLVGYGLAASNGMRRNLRHLSVGEAKAARKSRKRKKR